jgi:HPt (histidine-containing phosphotransfer) domain-containing protein
MPISLARLREALERCTAACASGGQHGGGRGGEHGNERGEHGGPPVLDWQAALQRLDGDAELLRELAALFLQDGPQLWRDVTDALAAQDSEGAARAVHSLKGVLMNFGAARAIAAADSRSMPALDAALQQLYAALGEALAACAPVPGDTA